MRYLLSICVGAFILSGYLSVRKFTERVKSQGAQVQAPSEKSTAAVAEIPKSRQRTKLVTAPSKKMASPDVDLVLNQARDRVDAGDSSGALAILKNSVVQDPANQELRNYLGEFLFQELKDYHAASLEFKAAYLANPEDERALEGLVQSLRAKGNTESAVAVLDEVRRKIPDRLEPALAMGDLYLDSKQPDLAIAVLRNEEAKHPNDPQIPDRLSEAYGRKKDFSQESFYLRKAETVLENLIRQGVSKNRDVKGMERDRASLILDLAASLADQGKSEEARLALQSVPQQDLRKRDLERYEQLRRGVSAN